MPGGRPLSNMHMVFCHDRLDYCFPGAVPIQVMDCCLIGLNFQNDLSVTGWTHVPSETDTQEQGTCCWVCACVCDSDWPECMSSFTHGCRLKRTLSATLPVFTSPQCC